MRLLAISDIHGCSATFNQLLDRLRLTREDRLVLGGDYIDRGPDSKGVIDRILSLRREGYQVTCLKGNHEALFLEGLEDEGSFLHWLLNGGEATLKSFGLTNPSDLPQPYLNFFQSLQNYHLEQEAIFVHAGLNFRSEDPLSDVHALLWIRQWYDQLDPDWLGDRLVVHGHTPATRSFIEKQCESLDELPVLDIDAGCVYERPGMNHLCAFDLTRRRLYFEPNREGKK